MCIRDSFSAANKVPRDSFNSLSESTGHVGMTTAFDSEIKLVNSCGSEVLNQLIEPVHLLYLFHEISLDLVDHNNQVADIAD